MRKVLSFVLVLSLVLGSFSMAFAADNSAGLTDVSGNANADAIQVAYDLGIVTGNPDGTYQPDKAVNRAEFAAMITRALAIPDSALAGYTSTTFKDTTGYGWAVPYLAFCQSKGIMLGDGAGNVMPGRTITVNEAVTMALRAIGYTQNSALLVGAWPANYVSIAQNEELYDDVTTDSTVNKASAAQIIYNLLTVQKVAVNADGDTVFQETRIDGSNVAANLLNTNLGAEEKADIILGDDYGYGETLINITGKLGAYGTAYVNDDDEVIAFTEKSTALTGKLDGDQFKVGDTKYDIASTFTRSAIFNNTEVTDDYGIITEPAINTEDAYADDGATVTLNVDLSGKKIKDVYSLVAWAASENDLAASDVQDDIADKALLGEDFAQNDDKEIDMKSFQLVGVASLEDIEEDNVVYVYTDNDGDIRKVAVGTETVEGIVEETDGDNTITIEGEDYDIAKIAGDLVQEIPGDIDVDSEGIFYLDANGKVYDFEGTTGGADTFAVIQAAEDEDQFNNMKFKLFLADESSKTMYLEDSADDIDWTTSAAMDTVNDATTAALNTVKLVGYSLNADGDIEALDVSARTETTLDIDFQSTKVLKIGTTTANSIDADAVVFTYEDDDRDEYDVAKLADVKKGVINDTNTPAAVILNDDDKVVALLVSDYFVDVEDDDVYGVFNTRSNAKTGDDNVYRFTGLIDNAEFNKKTDDRTNANFNPSPAEKFAVYKITVDANDVITNLVELTTPVVTTSGSEASGIIAGAINVNVDAISSDKTVITVGGDRFTIADDAAVYEWDDDEDVFVKADLSDLKKNITVSLYDTKGEDADGIASVVIFKD